jgi:hypothetical protein
MNVTGRTVNFPNETILTPASVGKQGIARIFSLPYEGDARGCEAQPLYVANVKMPTDGRTHNVIYSATMTNQIWAHDADNSQLLWMTLLDQSVKGSRAIDSYLINDHWGIVSTPVIDTDAMAMYVVTWGSNDQQPGDAVFLLHAISLYNGDPLQPPISLEGATYSASRTIPATATTAAYSEQAHVGTLSVQQKTVAFKSVTRKQRSSLLLLDQNGKKTVIIAAGSLAETASTSQGWLIAVDVASWSISATLATTVFDSGAGIWMSGAAPVADSKGFIYLATGNGDFDGLTEWGESMLKIQYTGTALKIVDWFTPYSDAERDGTGTEFEDDDDDHSATNGRRKHKAALAGTLVEGMSMSDWSDEDLGSGAAVLMEPLGLIACAGKDSVLYCAKMNEMGQTPASGVLPAGLAANYEKLAMPPIFFGYYNPTVNPSTTRTADLNVLYGGVSHHQHGEFIYWNRPTLGDLVYCWDENGNLRAWSITATSIKYLACSEEVASVLDANTPGGGMPGGMISLSSNGENDGIVWASIPLGNANAQITPGRLLAYDAQTFGKYSDGSGALTKLWDSQQWNIAYDHNKFNRVTVANGKVYVPTYNDRMDVYALA